MRLEKYWDPYSGDFSVASQQPVIRAKVLVANALGEVLLLKRAAHDSHRPGDYDLPGGGVQQGEKPVQAAARELLEEIRFTLEYCPARSAISKVADAMTPFHTFQYRSAKDGVPKLKHIFALRLAELDVPVVVDPNEHQTGQELWAPVPFVPLLLGRDAVANAIETQYERLLTLPLVSSPLPPVQAPFSDARPSPLPSAS